MKTMAPLLCLLSLAACSGKPPAPRAPAPPADQGRVAAPWDAMKADEQRAKDVQKIVDKQAEQQRKQIEAQAQ